MTIGELWGSYARYRDDFNSNARSLSVGAGAICWFFKEPEQILFPPAIQWTLALLALFFFLDLLHSVFPVFIYRNFIQNEEARIYNETGNGAKSDTDVDVPRDLDRPAWFLFRAKAVALFASFVAIFVEFICRFVVR